MLCINIHFEFLYLPKYIYNIFIFIFSIQILCSTCTVISPCWALAHPNSFPCNYVKSKAPFPPADLLYRAMSVYTRCHLIRPTKKRTDGVLFSICLLDGNRQIQVLKLTFWSKFMRCCTCIWSASVETNVILNVMWIGSGSKPIQFAYMRAEP